jgi:fructan beta-fructosidase
MVFAESSAIIGNNISLSTPYNLSEKTGGIQFPFLLNLSTNETKDFSIIVSNENGEQLVIGFDQPGNQYFIDRTKSGKTGFHKEFAGKHTAPRFATGAGINLTLLIDVSSVELFADDGLTVMTEIFFPNRPYSRIAVKSSQGAIIKAIEYWKLNPGNQ